MGDLLNVILLQVSPAAGVAYAARTLMRVGGVVGVVARRGEATGRAC